MAEPAATAAAARTLLIRNARVVATQDGARTELANADIVIRGNLIDAVGAGAGAGMIADEVIDARQHAVLPGLVNTHHHMFQ